MSATPIISLITRVDKLSNNQDSGEFNLVIVTTVQGELIAGIMKSHLESEGIPVYLKRESIGRVIGLNVDGMGKVDVMVPYEFVEAAKHIIMPGLENKPL